MKRLALAVLLLAPLAFAQTRGYRIGGIVVDAVSGSPVDGAAISITPVNHSGQPSEATAGEDGRFSFDNVAAGKYSLSAARRGYPRQLFRQHEFFSTAIVVGPDLDTGNLVFRLQPECIISGHITDEHNEPVAQAQVVLLRAAVGEGEMAVSQVTQRQTDDLGAYHFAHLAPGNYYVAVSARPWYAISAVGMMRNARGDSLTPQQERERSALNVAYPLTYYPSADEFTDAESIALHPGDRTIADISLHAVPALTVRIARPPGGSPRNRPHPSLSAVLPDGSTFGMGGAAYQSRNGEMQITGIAPGHYSLTAFVPGRRREMGVTTQQDIDLSSDTEISLQPGSSAAVAGKVDFGGVSCAQCRVVLTSTAVRHSYTAEIVSGGDFVFAESPPRGTYDIAVYGAQDVYVRSLAASGATVRGRQLTIPGGGAVSLALALSNGVGRVEGLARKNGQGLAGAMILLLPEDWRQNPGLVRRDQSDSDGSFTLPSVVPGNYLLLALESAWDLEWKNPAVIQPFLKNAERVQVAAGGSYEATLNVQPATQK